MNFIFSTLIVILFILLFTIFAAWIDKFGEKRKEEFIEKVVDKASDKLFNAWNKVGPWYLVVYIQESNRPIWISNNNIRSVHPDPKNRKLIIKQFNGEDMVIENVEIYKLCSPNEICDYDM
ncbi:hypothetical protein [Leyella stercorea]|uniref:hypothetical protein n=1 Tax=Leyella stercorea TaxID=363265 RepID=UPI0024316A63|nr:hypothetical protein [Leyella stercorea]